MGMNDELSPQEHADLRRRLVSGARGIKPAGAHRTAWIATAVAVVLVGGLAATAIGAANLLGSAEPLPVATQSPTPSATGSRSPSPTPVESPIPTTPRPTSASLALPFGGECANALSSDEVSTRVGGAFEEVPPTSVLAVTTLVGGLSCAWAGEDHHGEPVVMLSAYPDGIVPVELRSPGFAATCGYPHAGMCGVSGSVGATWVQVVMYRGEAAIIDELWSVVRDRADDFADPLAPSRQEDWWTLGTCEELASGVDFAEILGLNGASLTASTPTVGPATMAVQADAMRECVWTFESDDEWRTPSLVAKILPGGADQFARIADVPDAESVDVPGADAAIRVRTEQLFESHTSDYVIASGPNLLVLTPDPFFDETNVPRAASAVLAVLDR